MSDEVKVTWTADEQKAHRKLWVEALRSGNYQQARGRLRAEATVMCCLGVACDVSKLGRWSKDDPSRYITHNDSSYSVLPSDVREWLGLNERNGSWARGDTDCLSVRNDRGALFAEIANIIEAEPPGLVAS